ncbi:MAG: hypothetical protein ACXWPM_07135, partial [Bdellovibrionota bacterium]
QIDKQAGNTAPPPPPPPSSTTSGSTTSTSPTGSPTPVTQVTFQQVNSQVLQPNCAGCHSAGSSPDFSSYATTVSSSSVVSPGNPAASALYTAIQTGRMPKGGAQLSQTDQSLVYYWIQQGALNN